MRNFQKLSMHIIVCNVKWQVLAVTYVEMTNFEGRSALNQDNTQNQHHWNLAYEYMLMYDVNFKAPE